MAFGLWARATGAASGRRRRAAASLAVVLASTLLAGAGAPSMAGGHVLDQSCESRISYSMGRLTLDQSFRPAGGNVSAWEAKLYLFGDFEGSVHSRLVHNPTGDPGPDHSLLVAPSGVVVAETQARVVGKRGQAVWARFEPSAPVGFPKVSGDATYSIQIDLPEDSTVKEGMRVAWASCDSAYQAGRAFHASGAVNIAGYIAGPTSAGIPLREVPGATHSLYRDIPETRDFQFRTFTTS